MSTFADLANFTMPDNLTARRAASSRLSQAKILRPELAISTLASSTFVPYKFYIFYNNLLKIIIIFATKND